MNNIINKLLLAGDKFMPEMHLRQPQFKVGDHVRISKYKNIFAKGYTPNWFV